MFTSISFLLSFLFKIMMSLCKKSVHSFLGFSNSKDNLSSSEYLSHRNHHPPLAAGGLTFFSVSEDVERPVNVLESATIKKLPPPTTTTTTTSSTDAVAATTRANPGGSGFKKPPPPTTPTVVVAATRKGGSTIIGFKEQPPPITTTTDEGYPGGSGFPKSPLPTSETTTTSIVATTTNHNPGGIECKNPPTPTTTTTTHDVATTKGYLGGSSFPKPFPTTSGCSVATTTKSDPGGTDFRKTPPSLPRTTTDILESTPKRDPGSIGFLDEVGGSVDGLMSCTEGLGFESSDERRVDDQILNTLPSPLSSKPKKTIPFKKEVKKFPPPLSSLNDNGQPKFFLRPVRKDGRLELTEVKIHPQDILHASRQDGRLRLHFVFDKDEEAENQIEEEKQVTIQEDAKEFQENVEEVKLEGDRVEEEEGWKIPVMGGGGDGFRRCHELVASHRRHHHHVWSQRCVTIA